MYKWEEDDYEEEGSHGGGGGVGCGGQHVENSIPGQLHVLAVAGKLLFTWPEH